MFTDRVRTLGQAPTRASVTTMGQGPAGAAWTSSEMERTAINARLRQYVPMGGCCRRAATQLLIRVCAQSSGHVSRARTTVTGTPTASTLVQDCTCVSVLMTQQDHAKTTSAAVSVVRVVPGMCVAVPESQNTVVTPRTTQENVCSRHQLCGLAEARV